MTGPDQQPGSKTERLKLQFKAERLRIAAALATQQVIHKGGLALDKEVTDMRNMAYKLYTELLTKG